MFEVGETATMRFHGMGLVSEEEYTVTEIDGDIVTLDTDEDPSECFRFNIKSGRCINDNTYMGCHRTLKLK